MKETLKQVRDAVLFVLLIAACALLLALRRFSHWFD